MKALSSLANMALVESTGEEREEIVVSGRLRLRFTIWYFHFAMASGGGVRTDILTGAGLGGCISTKNSGVSHTIPLKRSIVDEWTNMQSKRELLNIMA